MSQSAKFKVQAVLASSAPLVAAAYLFGVIPQSRTVKLGVAALLAADFVFSGLPNLQFAFATTPRPE